MAGLAYVSEVASRAEPPLELPLEGVYTGSVAESERCRFWEDHAVEAYSKALGDDPKTEPDPYSRLLVIIEREAAQSLIRILGAHDNRGAQDERRLKVAKVVLMEFDYWDRRLSGEQRIEFITPIIFSAIRN